MSTNTSELPNPSQRSLDTIKVKEITDAASELIKSKSLARDAQLHDYLGEIAVAPSFHRQDRQRQFGKKPAAPDALPPYVAMLQDVHHLLRSELPKRMGIKLDETRLDARTQTLLAEVKKNILDYQATVKETIADAQGEPVSLTRLQNTPAVKKQITLSHVLASELSASPICRPDSKLPILVNGKEETVSNKANLGGALLSMHIASIYFQDKAKVPDGTMEFIRSNIDAAENIVPNLRIKCASTPQTHERFENAYASLLPDLITAIKKAEQPLQVLNLLKEREEFQGPRNAPDLLLKAAGLKTYPSQLQAPSEYYLTRDTLLKYNKPEGFDSLALERAHPEYPPEQPTAVAELAKLPKQPEGIGFLYNKQLDLLRDYAEHPHQNIAAAQAKQAGKRL